MAAERPGLVLLTADTVGGVWTYAVELAAALGRDGTRVALATMGDRVSPAMKEELAPLAGTVTLHESAHRLEWMQDPWDDVARAGDWLLALEAELRPDIVHLNQFAFGALPFRAPRLVVAHSCVCSWWQAVHHDDPPAEWDRYRDVVTAGLRGAHLVAAPTQAMLDALFDCYRYRGEWLVLPNARSPRRFAPAEKVPVVFAAGRLWDEAKNLTALETVAPSLPWPVRVAGPVEHPDGGIRATRGVELLGWLTAERLAEELGRAAIYALPARYEPFGLSVLEAALSGCALVLGDIPSLRELWDRAALFVPPHDTDALRAALTALMTDDGRRARLAAASTERARDFTPERMAAAYADAYARAAREARRTRHAVPPDPQEIACAS